VEAFLAARLRLSAVVMMSIFDAHPIQGLIVNYGYAAVFVVVLLESSGIPLPGETVLVCASVYAGTQHGLDIR
jgi:membrane protein DedA with SNARE-associated domain